MNTPLADGTRKTPDREGRFARRAPCPGRASDLATIVRVLRRETSHGPARRAEDREFMTMRRLFDDHGGMLTAEELVEFMRPSVAQPLSVVARWIVERSAVQFAWRSQVWFPCFQFAGEPMAIRPVVSQIVLELRDAYDDWQLALWFARRNECLDQAPPVAVIGCDGAAAVHAARADRFIVKG